MKYVSMLKLLLILLLFFAKNGYFVCFLLLADPLFASGNFLTCYFGILIFTLSLLFGSDLKNNFLRLTCLIVLWQLFDCFKKMILTCYLGIFIFLIFAFWAWSLKWFPLVTCHFTFCFAFCFLLFTYATCMFSCQ